MGLYSLQNVRWTYLYIHKFQRWGRWSLVMDELTYTFPNFNGGAFEVWEWISNFFPHLTVHFGVSDVSNRDPRQNWHGSPYVGYSKSVIMKFKCCFWRLLWPQLWSRWTNTADTNAKNESQTMKTSTTQPNMPLAKFSKDYKQPP